MNTCYFTVRNKTTKEIENFFCKKTSMSTEEVVEELKKFNSKKETNILQELVVDKDMIDIISTALDWRAGGVLESIALDLDEIQRRTRGLAGNIREYLTQSSDTRGV